MHLLLVDTSAPPREPARDAHEADAARALFNTEVTCHGSIGVVHASALLFGPRVLPCSALLSSLLPHFFGAQGGQNDMGTNGSVSGSTGGLAGGLADLASLAEAWSGHTRLTMPRNTLALSSDWFNAVRIEVTNQLRASFKPVYASATWLVYTCSTSHSFRN